MAVVIDNDPTMEPLFHPRLWTEPLPPGVYIIWESERHPKHV